MPRSKRLGSDAGSNVLVYMTGHGGKEFLKFQDAEEIGSWDLADAFAQMWAKKRYRELLFMIDTCQANTLYTHFYSPNLIATGSSALDQSSYSHHADSDVGVAVIDRWTYYILDFLETRVKDQASKLTLGDLFDSYDESKIHSQPGLRWDLFEGGEQAGRQRLVTDFFGNVQGVEVPGDATAFNETAFEDGMRWLRGAFQERERVAAEERTAGQRNRTLSKGAVPKQPDHRAARVEDATPWARRLLGTAALGGVAAMWVAASWLS